MSDVIQGRCLCGATRFEARAAPAFAIRCYCADCQKVSGGGSAPQVGFAVSDVTVSGKITRFPGKADSGSQLTFGFCGDCGSPISKSTSAAADRVFIYAGAFDDPSAVPPLRPVFDASRPIWDKD